MDLCLAKGVTSELEHLDLEAYGPQAGLFRSGGWAGGQGFLCVRNETSNVFVRRGNHPGDVSVCLQFSFCLEKTRS